MILQRTILSYGQLNGECPGEFTSLRDIAPGQFRSIDPKILQAHSQERALRRKPELRVERRRRSRRPVLGRPARGFARLAIGRHT